MFTNYDEVLKNFVKDVDVLDHCLDLMNYTFKHIDDWKDTELEMSFDDFLDYHFGKDYEASLKKLTLNGKLSFFGISEYEIAEVNIAKGLNIKSLVKVDPSDIKYNTKTIESIDGKKVEVSAVTHDALSSFRSLDQALKKGNDKNTAFVDTKIKATKDKIKFLINSLHQKKNYWMPGHTDNLPSKYKRHLALASSRIEMLMGLYSDFIDGIEFYNKLYNGFFKECSK